MLPSLESKLAQVIAYWEYEVVCLANYLMADKERAMHSEVRASNRAFELAENRALVFQVSPELCRTEIETAYEAIRLNSKGDGSWWIPECEVAFRSSQPVNAVQHDRSISL